MWNADSDVRPMRSGDQSKWLRLTIQLNISPERFVYECPADRTLVEARATALTDGQVAAWSQKL